MSFQVQVHVRIIICTCTLYVTYIVLIPNSIMCLSIQIPLYTARVYFSGNHTFAAIRGKEGYQLIGALSAVIGEMVTSKSLAVLPGVTVEVVLGDYKVSIHVDVLVEFSHVASGIYLERHTLSALIVCAKS